LNWEKIYPKFMIAGSVGLWAVVILVPLVVLFAQAVMPGREFEESGGFFRLMFDSFGLAAVIAAVSVLLGYIPGQLLGTSRRGKDLVLLLLLMPLVLPRYVLYYAWTLLLSPTTQVGRYLSSNPEVARFVGALTSSAVLVLWYWPLAGLLIAQGWRSIDRQIQDSARLDADSFQIFRKVTLPLLARPILLAFGVCLVLSLSEFATFHLAGIRTIGTELAVLYELTGSESCLIKAAWPVTIVAVVLAVTLGRGAQSWGLSSAQATSLASRSFVSLDCSFPVCARGAADR
jgi:ABC-type Fe3+ transport system permease subunit